MSNLPKLKERFGAQQIKEKFNITLDDDLYFISETSGTEGAKKTIFSKVKNYEITFKNLFKYFNYDGSKVVVTAPSDSLYTASLDLACGKVVTATEVKDLVKVINNNEAKYIFSIPSFIWNFKDVIEFNKDQVLLLAGEVIADNLYQYIKEKNITCYQFFGANEYNLMGAKKLEDEYYDFLMDEMKMENEYFHSPHLASGFIKEGEFQKINGSFKLNDIFEVKDRKFNFISRVASFAKINGKAISILEINKVLNATKQVSDFIVFKTNAENELDELALAYVGEIEENKLKDIILNHFNDFSYLPKKIKKIDKFPLSGYGKKDMATVREWVK